MRKSWERRFDVKWKQGKKIIYKRSGTVIGRGEFIAKSIEDAERFLNYARTRKSFVRGTFFNDPDEGICIYIDLDYTGVKQYVYDPSPYYPEEDIVIEFFIP